MKKIFHVFAILLCCLLILIAGRGGGEQINEKFPRVSSSSESFFTIQVATFTDEQRTSTLQKKLFQKGYAAYIIESLSEGGKKVYKIRIGKFKTRKEAEEFGELFLKKEKMDYIVVATKSKEAGSSIKTTEKKIKTASIPEKETKPYGGEEWPQTISKIYTYRGPDGTLYVTNKSQEIPEEFKDRLEKISIFPVKFVSFSLEQKLLYFRTGEKEQPIKLIGVDIFSPMVANTVNNYFKKKLKDLPLRFEFSPTSDDTRDDPLLGNLFSKQGKSINLEMIRQGIAPSYLENVPISQRKAFIDAEKLAKKEKLGIWATIQDKK